MSSPEFDPTKREDRTASPHGTELAKNPKRPSYMLWTFAAIVVVPFSTVAGLNRSGLCLSEMKYLSTTEFDARFNSHKNIPPGCCLIVKSDNSAFRDHRFVTDSIPQDQHEDNLYSRWWGSFVPYRTINYKNNEFMKNDRDKRVEFYAIDNCGNIMSQRESFYANSLNTQSIRIVDGRINFSY